MMRGVEESWILEVEGALEPIEGGSGMVSLSRGANQEESSCWKVIFWLLLLLLNDVDGWDGWSLSAVDDCFEEKLDEDRHDCFFGPANLKGMIRI